ncbi:MAG: glutamate synthase large subunit [Epsilonproteobacteria bacterium]|nr:glutamate synthase large subunit [Campylobacterota bacterium]PIP10452.1 MAG: glutamate synthase large subunit [Sulfurimonas sp. CG23_combo_of_CG06-09_8_20_14_all_36_33]PIS26667.1 MAG: glutamate synthase large subunit [Sulfurimonas sp. CG08_land_8_20_14_0_20_36_33]PIU33478.1 MAG: glutamate synthase large subunit [Sulfurimonas sp. CG07_land_8_20_14_0_80_36_56]PIV04922.1 MAG: glutamate synthase large subunit [Sulfurimonas sp. CG03_land_8_20_14_0_80_36_25]PIV35179.1 MAG: glutamate synthase larg
MVEHRDLLRSFKDNCGFGLVANLKNRASKKVLDDAVTALERMMHRGAIAADGKTGDGSGLLLSMPDEFLKKEAAKNGIELPKQYAVAVVFTKNREHLDTVEKICLNNDLKIVFTRDVPVDTNALGDQAIKSLPNIVQLFITSNSIMASNRFDALLYLSRKESEHKLVADSDFYIASMSSKVLSYKGLVMPTHIKEFYKDLQDDSFKISFSLFHQRFSTNTLPAWKLAQPFRAVAHNGEINSVEGNRINVKIKSESIKSEVFSDEEIQRILPILQLNSSDSASADNFFEFLIVNGMDFFKATRAVIPSAWQNAPQMDPELRAFYEYHSTVFEAWDGPAAFSVTDGRYLGCVLDRNGLRPSKYIITKDDNLLIASEYGVVDIKEEDIKERGRLQSGEMLGVDLKSGKILKNEDINNYLKSSNPYMKWLNEHMIYLQEHVKKQYATKSNYTIEDLVKRQRYFNITQEVVEQVIEPMMIEGKEAVGSMGDDTPLAAFSTKQRNFTDYFKQKFAQVTNPPIDPIREKVVMSLNTGFGEVHNILDEIPSHAHRLKSISPIITSEKLEVLKSFGDKKSPRYQAFYDNKTFSTAYSKNLKGALDSLVEKVIDSVKNKGTRIVILDDYEFGKENKIIPMAMVVGRLNTALLKERIRHLVSMVAVTGEVIDSHGAAVLIGYGASAIYPNLLFASAIEHLEKSKTINLTTIEALKLIHSSLNSGLLKIMSKMGIATIASYRNSGLFDVLGLSKSIVEECFETSHSALHGLDYEDIDERLTTYHKEAYREDGFNKIFPLNIGGYYKFYSGQEHHDFGPDVIHAIHAFSSSGKKEDYEKLKDIVNKRGLKFIRDFFELKSDRKAIDISEVESKEKIFKRFASAAMSLGSISPEAHETIAIAMNRIGAQSNSGEGGEDAARFNTERVSKIKQVASGRFGVTPAYLRSAEEIQIKVAQGAKPGEGGQLSGHKVSPLIAKLRHTVPGVTLISPPPHHDIYSIEDLAQLIFDMKQVNPHAKVAVKLVSTIGVGTIAAGVAKAYADKIIISGGDGGTGAAPLTSIKFAGNPWEIGLSEAHNALKANNLRGLVQLQTDGGLKTGLDVVKATLLGAESYAFGTGVLAIVGCKMLRICHVNKCSVGIATQNEKLRQEFFKGQVDQVVNFFTLLAEDIRSIMAELGFKTIEEMVGRVDLLKVVEDKFAQKFDFSSILHQEEGVNTCQQKSNPPFDDNAFEYDVLKEAKVAIKHPEHPIRINRQITNLNRSFGALISGEVAQYYGDKGLKSDTIKISLQGIAGQALGAFLIPGVSIYLEGVANDYIGKGMHGGKIVVTSQNQGEAFSAGGNTCLYGATGGKLYITGSVGERFAVRNSGAIAIVEGSGDNACEYMTGGIVAILGRTGINFGAGMTGGVSFVYDADHSFVENVNRELVEAVRIDTDEGADARHLLKNLLKDYVVETGSEKAKDLLGNFRVEVRNFWLIRPKNLTKLPLNLENGD